MSKKIVLTFGTESNRKASISLDDPKEDLTDESVKEAMDKVIAADIFETNKSEGYTSIKGAKLVETNEIVIIE